MSLEPRPIASRADVLVVSTRSMTDVEAHAIAVALETAGGLGCIVVDGRIAQITAHTGASPAKAPARPQVPAGPPGLTERLRTALKSSEAARLGMLVRGVAQDRSRLRKLFDGIRPCALVVFDDRRVRPDLVAMREARARNIPVVLVPFAVSTLESDIYLRRDRSELILGRRPWRLLKRHIGQRLSSQVQQSDAGAMTFYTPPETVVLRRLGLLPERPWVWGGGGADRICALGEDHRAYLAAGGIPVERIVVTGQPSLDALAMPPARRTDLRAMLRRRYGLTDGRRLAICAVPQHGEHALTDWPTHWRLTEELFAALAGSGMDVLLSLHPKSKRTEYAARAERHGLAILDERLAEALPAADVLVGSFSSTIAWSIGLEIPAIVIDALNSGFLLYRDLPGVSVLETHEALAAVLARYASEPEVLRHAKAEALRGSRQVGRIDGGNAERVARVIAEAAGASCLRTVSASDDVTESGTALTQCAESASQAEYPRRPAPCAPLGHSVLLAIRGLGRYLDALVIRRSISPVSSPAPAPSGRNGVLPAPACASLDQSGPHRR